MSFTEFYFSPEQSNILRITSMSSFVKIFSFLFLHKRQAPMNVQIFIIPLLII